MLRAWMTDSVRPAPHHQELPGRWIAKSSWPPPETAMHRLFLTDDGLLPHGASIDAASCLLIADDRQGRRKLVSVRPRL